MIGGEELAFSWLHVVFMGSLVPGLRWVLNMLMSSLLRGWLLQNSPWEAVEAPQPLARPSL